MTSRSVTSLVKPLLLVLSTAVFASGCALATPVAPSPSNPLRTTETFTGSFAYLGSSNHQFTVAEGGIVDVSLSAVGPLTTMGLGVSVNIWDGSACTGTSVRNDNARASVTALTGTVASGTYCVNVYDSGNLPSSWTATYTVAVTHP